MYLFSYRKSIYGKCPVDKTWFDPTRHVSVLQYKIIVYSFYVTRPIYIEFINWEVIASYRQ